MKIPLTQGKYALVSDEDFGWLTQWKWCFGAKGYAYRGVGTQANPRIYMHKSILDAPRDKQVDHINHNTLDNRRSNLRVCTNSQNQFNRRLSINTKTGYKGVSIANKRNDRWWAYINVQGKRHYLGIFRDKKEAAHAYNQAALKYHGEFAVLNRVK